MNFWRPLCRAPLLRAPLAVCDAQSMKPAEMLTYAHDPQPPPQNYILPLPNLLTVIAVTSGQRDGVSECVWQCACGSGSVRVAV